MKQYKVTKHKGGEVVAYGRNGGAWVPLYSGYSSEGRDMVAHFSEVLESKGYSKVSKG